MPPVGDRASVGGRGPEREPVIPPWEVDECLLMFAAC